MASACILIYVARSKLGLSEQFTGSMASGKKVDMRANEVSRSILTLLKGGWLVSSAFHTATHSPISEYHHTLQVRLPKFMQVVPS